MWEELTPDDEVLAEKCIGVMYQVDHAYQKLSAAFFPTMVAMKDGDVLYYEDGENELVIAIEPNPRLGLYRVYTAGYRGPKSPREMADIAVRRLLRFMREKDLATVFTIRRRDLDNPKMNDFFDAVSDHAALRVTVEHELRDRAAWKISAAGG